MNHHMSDPPRYIEAIVYSLSAACPTEPVRRVI